MGGPRPRVIVTMPAYRAVRTLEKTLHDIPPGLADEVVLVDDASPDGTADLADRLGLHVVRHPRNRGYGGNQKTCYDEALRMGGEVVVLLHPDYQYDPKMLTALVAPIREGRADFSFGSRFAAGGRPLEGGMPLARYLGNRLTTLAENLFLGTRFSELHSGLKAYNRFFLSTIDYHRYSDRFVFDSQMLIEAVLMGYRIEEVPIPTRYAEDSSSVDLKNSLLYIWQTVATLLWGLRHRAELRERGRAVGTGRRES